MTGNQVIPTMFDIKNIYSHGWVCTYGFGMKTLGLSYHKHVTHFVPGCDGVLFWVLSHRSTLYWSVAMYHSSHGDMDPQCTCSWPYPSFLVYMDLHCIGRPPCFESNMFWAWECPPQLWYIWSLVFLFAGSSLQLRANTNLSILTKVCGHQCTSDLIL